MTTTPRRLGQYELQKLLGHGNTGEVWQGYDLQRRQNVAVKLLHPDLLQADHNFINHFMKEWQAIIALRQSHIVQVHETDITRSNETRVTTPYIVMDYIEGHTTLADLIQHTSRVGKFPAVADIVSIFSCLGTAVDYAHEQNIFHNDIKPSNVLLDMHATQRIASGEPMLTDFGIGDLPGSDAILSPLYLSPEQVNGQRANSRSDIYALGVILYEMCTGVLPFHGESNVAIMMHHINTLPTPPMLINPHIPAALSEVILRAMAKDPNSRFATASQMATGIAEACAIEQDLHFT
ncbi:MAG TPA: serine/threonine-protein kinase, partial [Ktedonobacteraceae bacterium]|nr:serine/threonine-protein kinase [Ktedonobacteraceae bacterium]